MIVYHISGRIARQNVDIYADITNVDEWILTYYSKYTLLEHFHQAE